MKKKVIFRCDAGHAPEIGTGHIARSKTLANSLVDNGFLHNNDIIFYTRDDPDYDLGEKYLRDSGFKYHVFPRNELKANSNSELEILTNSNARMIFMDRLETSDRLVKSLLFSDKKIVTFDDYGSGRVHADLAISAIFDDIDESPNLVKGYEYLVLSNKAYRPKPIRKRIKKIVATFGGFDARDLCGFFLQNSSGISSSCSVDIVLGRCEDSALKSYYQFIESNKSKDRFKIHVLPTNYHEIIANADLAITSGGLSIFEFSAYGIPSIGLPQYEHQLRNIENLSGAGISLLGSNGMNLSRERFMDCQDTIMQDFNLRQSMALKARRSIDGGGVERIMASLKNKFPDNFYDSKNNTS